MSNKSTGTGFEKEFAQMLSDNGFWAHCMEENQNGQPFDVLAARNGATYVFDCKVCQGKAFRFSRIEENQDNAMMLWTATGNRPGLFAIRIQGRVMLVTHRMLTILRENGTKRMEYEDLIRYGRTFEQWVEHQNRLDKQVTQCR